MTPVTQTRLFEELLDDVRQILFDDELPTSARVRRAQELVGAPEYEPEEECDWGDDEDDDEVEDDEDDD